jgi:phosphate transporter
MFLGLFLSMWISNHTAPILLTTIVLPVVRDLPSDSRFSKALLVALAFGCNFGGMMTPISSLQNVLAVSYLEQSGIDVGFGRWVMAAVPFCVLCVLVAWVSILAIMTPNDVTSIPVIVHEKEALTRKNVAVITLSLLTIVMFATQQLTKGIFGECLSLCLSVSLSICLYLSVSVSSFSCSPSQPRPSSLLNPPRRHRDHLPVLPGPHVRLGHAQRG